MDEARPVLRSENFSLIGSEKKFFMHWTSGDTDGLVRPPMLNLGKNDFVVSMEVGMFK